MTPLTSTIVATTRVVAALVAITPVYASLMQLTPFLTSKGRSLLWHPMVVLAMGFGTSFAATGNLRATTTAVVLAAAVYQILQTTDLGCEYFTEDIMKRECPNKKKQQSLDDDDKP